MAQREGHPTGGRDRRPWWKKLLGIGQSACARQELTPDEDLQTAYRASSDGDLEHAAFHVGAVLKADPTDRRAVQLLDRLIAKCRETGVDPLTLAPLGKDVWVGTAAVHAYVLHAMGRHRDAIDLLRQAAQADQPTPWWRWAAAWAADPAAAREMDGDVAAGVLARAVMDADDVARSPLEREALEAAAPALATLAAAHPRSDVTRYIHVAALRKLGRGDEAVRLAAEWEAASPSYMSALSLANARHRAGDIDGAVAAFERAVAHQPDNAPAMADAAEMLAQAGRFAESLAWTERAKASDPDVETSSWVLWHYLMHKLGRDPAAMEKLQDFRRAHPNLREPRPPVAAQFGPYSAFIPEASEATVNVARDLAEKHDIRKVKLTQLAVTSIEAPSSRLAVERAMGIERNGLTIDVGEIPSPDPRMPRGPVDWTLWTYDGTTPLPGLAPPSARVSEAVAALASTGYDPAAWAAHASHVREALVRLCGSEEAAAQDVLATMVHPPPAPDARDQWTWIRLVQFAAAAILARIDHGWAGSVRRRALIALVRGPVDWTTEAGVVMLEQVCTESGLDDAAKREIGQLLKELSDGLPSVGYCCYLEALAWAVMRLPAEAGVTTADFAAVARRLGDDDDDAS
jgi:tetratricopeptide (TPR) repeat protein